MREKFTDSLKVYGIDVFAFFLVLLTLPLFLYKLGQSSLVSFDEAWYADIARNILKTKDPINLIWNGRVFIDHPPGGFLLTAASYLVFGITEFSTRFSSATLGFFTLICTYLLGKYLFKPIVGIISAIALAGSPWFLFRARSGNLDVPLTFFFVLTVYLALLASENRKYLVLFSLSLAFLFLIKTAVPFTLLPTIVFIFITAKKVKLSELKRPFLLFFFLVGGWFLYQGVHQPGFLKHYFKIGLPGVGVETSFSENLKLMKDYLHNGIGKWFWPGIISLVLGPFTFQKKYWILSIFFFSFFTPFLFSQKGHIWQLVPLHPFMIIAFFGFTVLLFDKVADFFLYCSGKLGKRFRSINGLLSTVKFPVIFFGILVIGFYYSYLQIKRDWYEFIDIPAYISDEAILSKEAGKFKEKFYIDEDFGPAAIYYSEKNVQQIRNEELNYLFGADEPFVLITHQWRLDGSGISTDKYEIIKSDRDKILVRRINL